MPKPDTHSTTPTPVKQGRDGGASPTNPGRGEARLGSRTRKPARTGSDPTVVSNAPPPAQALLESDVWRAVGTGWKHLSGGFHRLGFSFEWHDFHADEDFDWGRSFHPGSVEVCLNLSGTGEVSLLGASQRVSDFTAVFYRMGETALAARRLKGQRHQFITVELAPDFVARHLGSLVEDLHPLIQAAARKDPASGIALPQPLGVRHRELVASLRQPPVLASAQAIWFQAKAIEIMGEFFFRARSEEELFCHRQQRVARQRVEAVQSILKRDLSNTPSLDEISREVGCSPFYLSRTFSKEVGQTIPQYIRSLRLERAAELLKSGKFNVTEAALEVGYNSLSHFSQAFHATFGCCPGLFPVKTPAQASQPRPGNV